jgi:hypothetical protein
LKWNSAASHWSPPSATCARSNTPFAAAANQARIGRHLVTASAHTGELPDRLAGLEETHSAKRRAVALAPLITEAESEVDARRQAFLDKRVECRQAETLIREAEARDALVLGRRTQQGLDDWYLNRLLGGKVAPQSPIHTDSEASLTSGDTFDVRTGKNLNENLATTLPEGTSQS